MSLSVLPLLQILLSKLALVGPVIAQATTGYDRSVEQGNPGILLVSLLVTLLNVAALWRIFDKAGQPGWAVIIPIYNAYVLCEVAEKPIWWLLLLLIPVVNVFATFFIMLALARVFGRSVFFGVGLFVLSFVFLPILAFGDSQYGG